MITLHPRFERDVITSSCEPPQAVEAPLSRMRCEPTDSSSSLEGDIPATRRDRTTGEADSQADNSLLNIMYIIGISVTWENARERSDNMACGQCPGGGRVTAAAVALAVVIRPRDGSARFANARCGCACPPTSCRPRGRIWTDGPSADHLACPTRASRLSI